MVSSTLTTLLSASALLSVGQAGPIKKRADCTFEQKQAAIAAEIATINSHSADDAAQIPLSPLASRTFFITPEEFDGNVTLPFVNVGLTADTVRAELVTLATVLNASVPADSVNYINNANGSVTSDFIQNDRIVLPSEQVREIHYFDDQCQISKIVGYVNGPLLCPTTESNAVLQAVCTAYAAIKAGESLDSVTDGLTGGLSLGAVADGSLDDLPTKNPTDSLGLTGDDESTNGLTDGLPDTLSKITDGLTKDGSTGGLTDTLSEVTDGLTKDGSTDGLTDGLTRTLSKVTDGLTKDGSTDGLTDGLTKRLSKVTDGLTEDGSTDGLTDGLTDTLSKVTDGLTKDGSTDGLTDGLTNTLSDATDGLTKDLSTDNLTDGLTKDLPTDGLTDGLTEDLPTDGLTDDLPTKGLTDSLGLTEDDESTDGQSKGALGSLGL